MPSDTDNLPPHSNHTTKPSYADKTKPKITPLTDFEHPKDDQGIVFHAIRDYKIRDYLVAIMNPVGGPKNIVAISKISKNRIVCFLKSAELVNSFINDHNGFKIEQDFIPCRKLKSPTKRIIFSNVSPTIPNDVLQEYIVNELKIKLLSGISILRVNPIDQLFGHVISFRRQIYTNNDIDTNTLPGSFELTHDERTHRVFITFDEFSCFKCKSKGHRAEDCSVIIEDIAKNNTTQANLLQFPPLKPTESSSPNINRAMENINSQTTTPTMMNNSTNINADGVIITELNDSNRIVAHDFDKDENRNHETYKRPLSTTSSSSIPKSDLTTRKKKSKNKRKKQSESTSEDDSETDVKTAEDKMETDNVEDTDSDPANSSTNLGTENETRTLKEIFAPLETNMTTYANRYPITLSNLSLFIDMCKVNNQAATIASEFTPDLKGLHTTLKENYKFLTDRKTKIKFTKIMKQLEAEFSASAQK